MPNGLLNILLLKATKFSCFLWSFLLFFGDFFEVVLQVTSAMFVTNYPRVYAKVGFCYSQTEKSPVNRLKIRACSKSPLVYTGDLESAQKSSQKSPV